MRDKHAESSERVRYTNDISTSRRALPLLVFAALLFSCGSGDAIHATAGAGPGGSGSDAAGDAGAGGVGGDNGGRQESNAGASGAPARTPAFVLRVRNRSGARRYIADVGRWLRSESGTRWVPSTGFTEQQVAAGEPGAERWYLARDDWCDPHIPEQLEFTDVDDPGVVQLDSGDEFSAVWSGHVFRLVDAPSGSCAAPLEAPSGRYRVSLEAATALHCMEDEICGPSEMDARLTDATPLGRLFHWPDEREVVIELD